MASDLDAGKPVPPASGPPPETFECPYGCEDCSTDSMDDWLEHMRNEHGVNGPL